ncbi:hypothetical protein JKP88DRAFT_285280 [Tribonema minus]|uniref:Uncharacterized protein n=1 Tax=Tribonema minus TaxID=303371 RepID=A0A835ZCK2_9STRA|nr:hypothetical protein JKP88DRAFT_285280 [Tribonema minus]
MPTTEDLVTGADLKTKLRQANLDKLQLYNKRRKFELVVLEARANADSKMEDTLAKSRTDAEVAVTKARSEGAIKKHNAEADSAVQKHQAEAAAAARKAAVEAEQAVMTIKDEHMIKRRAGEVIIAGIEALTEKIVEKGDVNDLAQLLQLGGLEADNMSRHGFINMMKTKYKTDVGSYFFSQNNNPSPFVLENGSRYVCLNPEWFHQKVTNRLGCADWNCKIPENLTHRVQHTS